MENHLRVKISKIIDRMVIIIGIRVRFEANLCFM